jgi:trehalose 6-phosphate phosphatase
LCRSLERLVERTGGALALISGPQKFSAVGGHGAEMRVEGTAVRHHIRPLPKAMRDRVTNSVPASVLIEDKGYSIAVHYRGVPVGKDMLQQVLTEVSAAYPNESVEILPGKEMLELKRAGINKGEAVRQLMTHAPFAGRTPIFIGDDVTDESVFATVPELGGESFSVARKFDGLTAIFDSPATVRATLAQMAGLKG